MARVAVDARLARGGHRGRHGGQLYAGAHRADHGPGGTRGGSAGDQRVLLMIMLAVTERERVTVGRVLGAVLVCVGVACVVS